MPSTRPGHYVLRVIERLADWYDCLEGRAKTVARFGLISLAVLVVASGCGLWANNKIAHADANARKGCRQALVVPFDKQLDPKPFLSDAAFKAEYGPLEKAYDAAQGVLIPGDVDVEGWERDAAANEAAPLWDKFEQMCESLTGVRAASREDRLSPAD